MAVNNHAKDVPLLYTKSLHEWNYQTDTLGFSPRILCEAKTYLDCSLPVCPWVNVVYSVKPSVVVYSEHCSKQGGRRYKLVKHANQLKGSEFGGVVRGTADYVCFTFVKNKVLTGIIVDENTTLTIGQFQFPLVEPTVCQLWHFSVSRNQRYVGLLVHMKPNIMNMNHLAPEEFDVHVFEAYDRKDSMWLYRPLTCVENLKSDLEGGLRSLIVPRSDGMSHSCMLVPCWYQKDQHHAHLYDVNSSRVVAQSPNLYRYFPVEGEPILKVCIHQLLLSPDEALALLCMEQKVEMTGQKLSKVLVMNAQNLQVLRLITTCLEIDWWWITASTGCYVNVVPSLHSNGYQIAQLNTVADRADESSVNFINVYQLPHVRTDLKSWCRYRILHHIRHCDIDKLSLPLTLIDFLKFQ